MRTGAHILYSETKPGGTVRAWCACGNWKSDASTVDHARILHGAHFDAVVRDAQDAAEQAVRPERCERCERCGLFVLRDGPVFRCGCRIRRETGGAAARTALK